MSTPLLLNKLALAVEQKVHKGPNLGCVIFWVGGIWGGVYIA